MATWLTSFRASFLESALDVLWGQWTTLGVLGRGNLTDRRPVDPEALLTLSVFFGRFDPRLFDAFLEWWSQNDQWLSSTRLRRLSAGLKPDERRILSAIVESVLVQKHPKKWQRLATSEEGQSLDAGSEESLFLMPDGRPLPALGNVDPVFRRFGFLRGRFERRGIAQEVPLQRRGNERIRLRGLFGVTSRAEIVLYLLTHEVAHARLISRHAHYSYDAVSTALGQMNLAGFVTRERHAREVEYRLEHENWSAFLKLPARTAWVDWARTFSALRLIWTCTNELVGKRVTDAILGAELYHCALRANRLLRDGELDFAFPRWEERESSAYPKIFDQEVRKLFRALQLEEGRAPRRGF